jgi:hypothetical protein
MSMTMHEPGLATHAQIHEAVEQNLAVALHTRERALLHDVGPELCQRPSGGLTDGV